MSLSANFRSYYFYRDNGAEAPIAENEAWAAGGTLFVEYGGRAYRGGWLRLRYGIINPGKRRESYNIRATLNWPLDPI